MPFGTDLSGVTWHDVELLDRASVRAAVSRLRPATVFHLAGAAHVGQSWQAAATTLEINVLRHASPARGRQARSGWARAS